MKQRETFKLLLAFFAILLMLMPPFAALNAFMTKSVERAGWYKPIQEYIVPMQARMVAVVIRPFGIESKITPYSKYSTFYMVKNNTAMPVDLAWNCLGWQSGLLLLVSLVAGLRGPFTTSARIYCIIFGLLGTLLINVGRMSFIAVAIYYVNSLAAQIVHDYFAAFITLIWLGFFWWFSYTFILEEKKVPVLE